MWGDMYFNCGTDCCFGCGDECQVKKKVGGEKKKEANKAFFCEPRDFFWEQLTEETLAEKGQRQQHCVANNKYFLSPPTMLSRGLNNHTF